MNQHALTSAQSSWLSTGHRKNPYTHISRAQLIRSRLSVRSCLICVSNVDLTFVTQLYWPPCTISWSRPTCVKSVCYNDVPHRSNRLPCSYPLRDTSGLAPLSFHDGCSTTTQFLCLISIMPHPTSSLLVAFLSRIPPCSPIYCVNPRLIVLFFTPFSFPFAVCLSRVHDPRLSLSSFS